MYFWGLFSILWYGSLSEYEDWSTEGLVLHDDTANILIIACLIELKKAYEYMYHGTVFGRKEMQLWQLSWVQTEL